jgi:hypothetical protein
MGVSYNPTPIATSGLSLNLDAGNTRSVPSGQNLLRFSQDFVNELWIKTQGLQITSIGETAPDGSSTASIFRSVPFFASGEAFRAMYVDNVAEPSYRNVNTTYTFSIYIKNINLSRTFPNIATNIYNVNFGGINNVVFSNYSVFSNTYGGVGTAGSWTSGGTTVTDVGNGWYRVSISANTVANTYSSIRCEIWLGGYRGTPPGEEVGSVALWGAQLETGSSVTPYTPTKASIVPGTWYDLSNSSNNGVLMNRPTYTSGTNGYFTFNYLNSQYVNFPSNPSFNFLNRDPYTLEAWVYPTRNPGANNWTGIFDRESTFNQNRDGYNMYFLGSGGTDTYFFTERFTSGAYNPTSITLNQSVSVNNWHHVVGTYDGTTLSLYRNGSIVSSNSSTGNLINTTKELNIGVRGGQYFDGRISNAKVYNRALSAAEVAQNFASLRTRYGI